MNTYLVYGIIFVILLVLELVYFKIADKFNIIDKPNERSSHSTIVLRGGGIIFLIGMWVWSIAFGFQYPWFLLGLTLVAGVSFIDDIHSLPDSVRLVVQFTAAALAFYQLGMLSGEWFESNGVLVGGLLILLALIVYVGATNVINFMDGINGITAGYALAVLVPLLLLNASGDFETKTIKTPEAAASISMCENPSELDSSPTETSATVFNGSVASSGKKQEKQVLAEGSATSDGTEMVLEQSDCFLPDGNAETSKGGCDVSDDVCRGACSPGNGIAQGTEVTNGNDCIGGRGFSCFCLNKKGGFVDNSLVICAILSVLVFCIFNFRPKGKAKCFAGDVGSIGIAFIMLFLIGKVIIATGDLTYLIFLLVYGVDGVLTICHRIMLHENLGEAHRKHAYQLMCNELKIGHVKVSMLYMAMQLVVSLGFIYVCPSTVLAHWMYLLGAFVLLAVAYVLFKKKYYHLHEEYIASLKK